MTSSERPTYQITRHPIGSFREMWSASFPLMLGLMSGSFMLFFDRVFLSHFSVDAMNAVANAGLSCWGWMMFGYITAETTEVFVGRYNGEGNLHKAGKPVWQMLYFILILIPFFSIGSRLAAPWIFAGTGNTINETAYFVNTLDFGAFFISSVAFAGFFSGIGQMHVVTRAMIGANIANIALNYLLVFEMNMGIGGSAIATGIAQLLQTAYYLSIFLSKKYRTSYGTTDFSFDKAQFLSYMRVALPSTVGRIIEIAAHMLFFRFMIMSGKETMTIATMVQSAFLLCNFMIDGLSKGSTAIVSNLIGADRRDLVPKVLRTACLTHIMQFAFVAFTVVGCTELFGGLFFAAHEQLQLQDAHFLSVLRNALFWMSVFFLFDGFGWIFFGLFTATSDTKFVMYISTIFNWVFYILPVYYFIGICKGDAAEAWMICACANGLIISSYLLRYRLRFAKQAASLYAA